jgi:hypothetical protein
MARASRKPPQDVTGRMAEKLAEQHAEELAGRAGQITTITGTVSTTPDGETEVDYTAHMTAPEAKDAGGIKIGGNKKAATRRIQVNCDLENVTIGIGNNYTFKRGVWYTVPAGVAAYLDAKGLVWH